MPPTETKTTMPNYKPNLKNLLKTPSNFSRPQLILFALVFALIGILIYRSLAASPLVASLEAEQMSLPTGASVVNDTSASGGKALLLTANGTTSGSVNFPSAVSSLSVIARGTACSGSPAVSVSLDGTNYLTNTAISSTSWSSYSATPASQIASGTHNLSISFNNDYTNPGHGKKGNGACSRSVYLDVTNFYGPAPPPAVPTVTLSASPPSVTAGTASTLTWNSTNAASCTASGAWSGSQPTSGSTSTGALNQTSTYTLACTGAGGTATQSTTVSVSSVATSPDNTVVNGTAGQIVDANHHIWTITTGAQVAVDGVTDPITSSVTQLAYESGKVWQHNSFGYWWYKILPTDTWLPTGGTTVSPIPGSGGGTSGSLPKYNVSIGSKPYNEASTTLDFDLSQEKAIGTGMIRMDYGSTSDNTVIQKMLDAGFQVELIIGGTTKAPGPGTSAMASLATAAATTFKGKIHYYEVLNEPDLNGWTADSFVPYQKAVYTAIKAVDPTDIVWHGGMWDGNQATTFLINWVAREYALGIKPYFDAFNFHCYGNLTQHGSWQIWDMVYGSGGAGFYDTTNIRSIMNSNGDSAKPIVCTEGGNTVNKVSLTEQATDVTLSLQSADGIGTGYRKTQAMFIYTMLDNDVPGFGMLDASNNKRPSWTAFYNVAHGL